MLQTEAVQVDQAAHTEDVTGVTKAQNLGRWLKVIGEPNRLRLLDLLMQGEQCNCEMGGTLGMAPNLISHHLSVLQKAGLVDARRDPDDARWIHYTVNRAALDALNRAFAAFFDPARIQPRHSACPPTSSFIAVRDIRESQGSPR